MHHQCRWKTNVTGNTFGGDEISSTQKKVYTL